MLRCGQDGLLTKLSQHGTEKATPEPWGWGCSGPLHSPRGIFCSGISPCVSPLFHHLPVVSCTPQSHYLQQSLPKQRPIVGMAARMWTVGQGQAWRHGKRLGAERGAEIKKCRNQRKGTLTTRQRLRYVVVSQGGTSPSLNEAQGPDQGKEARLGARGESKTQPHTLGTASPPALQRESCHTWAIEAGVLRFGVCEHMQSLRGQSGGCLPDLRGENWNLATFLQRAVAVMKYSCSSYTAV